MNGLRYIHLIDCNVKMIHLNPNATINVKEAYGNTETFTMLGQITDEVEAYNMSQVIRSAGSYITVEINGKNFPVRAERPERVHSKMFTVMLYVDYMGHSFLSNFIAAGEK